MLNPPPRKYRRRPYVADDFNGTALKPAWAKTDTETKLAVSGGALVVAGGKAVPAFDDPRLTYGAQSWLPRAGLTFEAEITWSAFGAGGCDFGLDNGTPVTDAMRPGFQVFAGGVLRAIQAQTPIARQATAVTLATGVPYRFKLVLLDPTAGVLWLFSADRGLTWTVVFADGQYPTPGTPLWLGLTNNDAACSVAFMRAYQGAVPGPALSDTFAARTSPGRADTGQPWLIPNGKVIPLIAGDLRIPAGQAEAWLVGWSGVGDGVWECDLNFGSAPSTQKVAYVVFRQRDTSNYMRVTIHRVAQQIAIVRLANGVATTVASLSGAGFADNTTYRMRVAAYGAVIVVSQDGAEKLRTGEEFGRYFGLCSWYVNDNLAVPDIRLDTVRAWGFPTPPLLADSFDRPDDTASVGIADTGQAYAPAANAGAAAPVWGIEQGRAGYFVGSGNDKLAWAALARGSYLVWGKLRTKTLNGGIGGFLLRYLDPDNFVVLRLAFPLTQSVSLFRDLAGARATVVSSTGIPALGVDVDYLAAVVVTGNVFEGWLDGVRYLSAAITDFPQNPAAGPYATAPVVRMDDLRYVPLGTALQHDTFTRADSATTAGATELPGTPWTALFGGTWGIVGNQLYNVDTSSARGLCVPILVPDVDVSCDLIRQAASVGFLLRLGGNGSDYLLVQFDGTSLLLKERVAGGAIPTLLTVAYAWVASGTARTVRCRVFQGNLSISVNEVLLAVQPFTGHAGAAEVYYGLYNTSAGATTNRFDNFLVREVPAVPVPPLASDTFTRADNAASLGPSEVPGAAWTPAVGVWGISAGQAYSLDTSASAREAILAVPSQSVRVEADLTYMAPGMGLVLRCSPNGSDLLQGQVTGAFLNLRDRVASGALSNLLGVPAPGGWAVGQTRRMGLEATPANLLRLFLDGGLVGAVPFSGHVGATETGAGLYVAQSVTTNRFDNFLVSVVPLPGACPGIADGFARPDSVASMGNTPAPWAAAWVLPFGGANWGIVGGKAYSLDTSSASRGALVWHGLADFTIQADMTRATSGAVDQVGFWMRAAAAGGDYFYVRTGGTTLAVIERVAAGTSVSVASAPYVWNPGETRRMRCTFKAGVLTVYINDVLLITQAIAGHPAATEGYAGFFHASDTTQARFDNFALTPA